MFCPLCKEQMSDEIDTGKNTGKPAYNPEMVYFCKECNKYFSIDEQTFAMLKEDIVSYVDWVPPVEDPCRECGSTNGRWIKGNGVFNFHCPDCKAWSWQRLTVPFYESR